MLKSVLESVRRINRHRTGEGLLSDNEYGVDQVKVGLFFSSVIKNQSITGLITYEKPEEQFLILYEFFLYESSSSNKDNLGNLFYKIFDIINKYINEGDNKDINNIRRLKLDLHYNMDYNHPIKIDDDINKNILNNALDFFL